MIDHIKVWAGKIAGWLPIMFLVTILLFNLPELRPIDQYNDHEPQVTLIDILMFEERYREVPYLDSEGYVTIGIGHKLSNIKGIDPKSINLTMSEEEAMSRLMLKIGKIRKKLSTGKYKEVYNNLSVPKQMILESMAYQMGVKGLYKFKKMWGAMYLKCWELASMEALKSKWAKKQSKKRARRQAEVLRTGKLTEYNMEIFK